MWIKALGIGLGLAAGSAAILYHRLFRRPLPKRTGNVVLDGLDTPAEVLWDSWGVPHVYAQTQDDLFFLQGYLHAQDRLWQMELSRRAGAGRLSELFGERTLEADRFLRRIGLHRTAQKELELLDAETGPLLSSYCRGVNAFLRSHLDRLPLEFSLLHHRPEPWRPLDSLVWAKTLAWSFSSNLEAELSRASFIERLGSELAAHLEHPYRPGHPLTTPPGATEPLQQEAEPDGWHDLPVVLHGGASNAWVVDGTRSGSGKPLLANDPHLVPQLPSVWYEMHLECPTLRVTGVSVPGEPGIVIGHNQHIAWGVTASMVDIQDVYVEEFSPDKPSHYRFEGDWHKATVVQERIHVKGRRMPVVEEVAITRHGPVFAPPKDGSHRALALRSTFHEPSNALKAGLALAKAANWAEFRAGLADWSEPAVNFVYADAAGNIGYQLAGRLPRRLPGTGAVPLPGWSGDKEWQGYLTQEEIPSSYNPGAHYIINANNKVAGQEHPAVIVGEWADGYRVQRIQDLILQKDLLRPEDAAAMQMDVLSLPAKALLELVRGVHPRSPAAQQALDYLLAWDGRIEAGSTGAALYEVFRLCLRRNLLSPVLGPHMDAYFGMHLHPLATSSSAYQSRGASYLIELLGSLDDTDPAGLAVGVDKEEVINRSLEEAVAQLRLRLGRNQRHWTWGRLHHITFRHPMGQAPILGRLLNRGPYPLRGDTDTIHQASYSLRRPYEAASWQPSYRFIADTADWDRCLSIHAPGQSGQPGSSHYDDMIPLWRRGEYHPMPFSRDAVEAAAVTRQEFSPG